MKIRSRLFRSKLLIPVFLFGVFFFVVVFFREEVFRIFATWSTPILKAENQLTESGVANEGRGDMARIKDIKLEILRKENAHLREILGRKGSKQLVVASVLARPPVSLYDTFLLDAGSDAGVSVGSRVFVYGNIAVGEVVETAPTVSKVKLYSSPDEITQVMIGEEHVSATIHGTGAGNFRTKLPRGISIHSGEKVIFPGLEGGVVGVVEHIEKNEKDTFQTVFIKSPVNVWSVRYLQIEI